MSDLVVIGGIALDYLSKVKDASVDCTQITEYSENIGGMGYNTAITAAQLGMDTRLVAAVGSDFPILNRGKNINFDLHRREGMTTRSFLFFDDKKEKIYFHRGTYHEIDIEKAAMAIQKSDWVHFAGVIPCFSELIKIADEENKITSLNPGYDIYHYDPKDKLVSTVLDKSDYIIMSSEEAKHISRPVDSIVTGAVIVTMGKNGSLVVEKDQRSQINSYPVTVDSPFGAGDTYTGAFITSMMLEKDVVESARIASAAASFAVEERSTTPRLDWEQIEKRVKKL